MGTGDFICVSMTGGAPWGFRLQGGREQRQPLRVAKIRSQSKASGSGLCEGDEVVSINGTPCADLTYPQVIELMESVTESLQMLIKRPSSGINETLISETEIKNHEHSPYEGCVESTALQSRQATKCQYREPCITPAKSGAPLAEDQGSDPGFSGSKTEETVLSYQAALDMPEAPRGHTTEEVILREKAAVGRPGPMVELQLSLSQKGPKDMALLGAEKSKSPDSDPNVHHGRVVHINSVPTNEKGDACLRSSKIIQISSGQELRVIQARETGDEGLPRVEVIFDCSDRQKTEGCRLQAGNGGVDAPGEGGQSEAPPSLVSFAVSSEGTEQGDEARSERDHSRPHKHRARHARLRRSESLSERQVKEAKSRCKRIALLLTDAPSPHSRGVLMFRRRRRRARQFTLVSYGTGRPGRRGAEEPDDAPPEAATRGATESDADEELPCEAGGAGPALSFDWDSGLAAMERGPRRGDASDALPDAAGKGARMFARRRERVDQVGAQAARAGPVGGGGGVEPARGPGLGPPQNGLRAAPAPPGAPRAARVNRAAQPFPGPAASAPRAVGGPLAELPAPPPPYSALPPPGPAQPPPWPQPAPWAPPASPDAAERIASRDERIAVPAKRTGILQEAKRRSTTKPMFTFKEPKVSPNPELLSLLQTSEGRRGAAAAGDSGPEEDYLSLGAEACNFMQSPAAKQKTPPPVAPKPAGRASSQPAAPGSPVWPPAAAAAQPPAFPACGPPPGAAASSTKAAQPPACPAARPTSSPSPAGPFRAPQAAKPAAPTPAAGPCPELPEMGGKGAQLFARRQSRMEKYVVDADTVQAHAARAQSPTPSLPATWKYSPNVRAPPPVAYNPIHSPSYPLAAVRSQSAAPQAPKTSKKKGKKPLNALDVMKHQPYQLNASLFTFQPPDAKAGLPQKSPAKVSSAPAVKQALPPRAVNAGSPTGVRASSVYSVPAYSAQPAFFAEATSPVSASPVPGGLPSSPKQESASAPYFMAPRPKFSAKKSGVTVQEREHSLSLPGRPTPPAIPTASPWAYQPAWSSPTQPAGGLERANRRLSPWEAAAQSPCSRVDAAFKPRSIQESIVANVVSAARRKVLPGALEDWGETLSCVPQAPRVCVGSSGREHSAASLPNDSMLTSSQYGSQPPYAHYRQPSRNDSEVASDHCLSGADCNYNPHPRGWRRQTSKSELVVYHQQ